MTHHLGTSERLSGGSGDHLSTSSPDEGLVPLQPRVDNYGHGDMRPPVSAGTGQLNLPIIDSQSGFGANPGRMKHRRKKTKKRRNWRPYHQLSWEERRQLDERETVRAVHRREEMFARGRPMAPYNTTQYLMDVHYGGEPAGLSPSGDSDRMEVNGRKDGSRRPRNAREMFLHRYFSPPARELRLIDGLQSLTMRELVQKCRVLQRQVSRLQDENNRLRRAVAPSWAVSES